MNVLRWPDVRVRVRVPRLTLRRSAFLLAGVGFGWMVIFGSSVGGFIAIVAAGLGFISILLDAARLERAEDRRLDPRPMPIGPTVFDRCTGCERLVPCTWLSQGRCRGGCIGRVA